MAYGVRLTVPLVLLAVGCKTYRVAADDGGDGSARDGGSASDVLADGGADRGADDAPADESFDAGLDQGHTVDAPVEVASDATADSIVDTGPDLTKIAPPRLIAPLSTATVTSRRPLLHWVLPSGTDGAHVELCHDRACSNPIVAFDTTGAVGAPAIDLPTGVVFWHAFGRSNGSTGTTSTPTWQFNVGARSAPVNTSWGTTLDVNGDGYADIVVGAYGANHAFVYLGGASGPSSSQQSIALEGPSTTQAFGATVASAGDINGDGFADVFVTDGTNIYMFSGGTTGLQELNGDGYADVIIGSYVYLGASSGLLTQQPIMLINPNGDGTGFANGIPAISSAGDVNGDGWADIVIGAPFATNLTGMAYVYLGGSPNPFVGQQPASLTGPDGPNGEFGASVAGLDDIDGDGYGDIIVGAPDALGRTGHAYIYFGGIAGLSSRQQPVILTGPDGVGSTFGGALAHAGDLDGDGYPDIAVGAIGALADTGRVYLYRGGSMRIVSTTIPTILTGPDGGDGNFGNSLGH